MALQLDRGFSHTAVRRIHKRRRCELLPFIFLSLICRGAHGLQSSRCFIATACSARHQRRTPSRRVLHAPRHATTSNNDRDSSVGENGGDDNVGDTAAFQLLKNQLQQQQQQIDALIQLLTKQQRAPAESFFEQLPNPQEPTDPIASAAFAPPLKVMLFIDGTWLYYSIHERPERDCPIVQKYGRGWQQRFEIKWSALPKIICRSLQGSMHSSTRPLEVVRASVYTSYKADINKYSPRYKLFQDMQDANYDVHIMETVGKSEKCVDIQIAVELMHYATESGGAFDVGLLLTGDKDFMPAMIRTRQKGCAVGLISMKRGCNRALVDTPRLLDFDVMWLEDHLDELIVPKEHAISTPLSSVSLFTFQKVIHDFIRCSGFKRVSSRDMGRYLKLLHVHGQTLLDEIKNYYGGLHQLLTSTGTFVIEDVSTEDKSDHSYWVGLVQGAEEDLRAEAKRTTFSAHEKEFFESYNTLPLQDKKRAYGQTMLLTGQQEVSSETSLSSVSLFTFRKVIHDFIHSSGYNRVSSRDMGRYLKLLHIHGQALLDEIKLHYGGLHQLLTSTGSFVIEDVSRDDKSDHSYWVGLVQGADEDLRSEAKRTTLSAHENEFFESYNTLPLQDKKRHYGQTMLLTGHQESGAETTLPENVTRDFSSCTVAQLKDTCREFGLPVSGVKAVLLERVEGYVAKQAVVQQQQHIERKRSSLRAMVDETIASHLKCLVVEYLHAKGGVAGSRDVGRYLAANKSISSGSLSALKELKGAYGSLNIFASTLPETLDVENQDEKDFEFMITLRKETKSN